MGHVVAIANQKGGVGKTTTTVNLAASLAVAEKRVLVVDLDPQGNASSGLGRAPDAQGAGTYEVLLGERTLPEVVMPTELAHLELAPATRDLVGIDVQLVQRPDRERRLRRALAQERDRWDFVIVDCPPSLGLLTLNALVAADGVLVPLQAEYYALEGLSHLVDTIGGVRARLNPGLEIEGLVFCMYDARPALSRQVRREVERHFEDKVYDTVIPRNVRLSEAPSHGRPALLHDLDCRGAQSYLRLAREYLARRAAARAADGSPT